MARTNSSFKLSKDTKRVLASIVDSVERATFKQAMIDAEHSYTTNRHRRFKDSTETTKE